MQAIDNCLHCRIDSQTFSFKSIYSPITDYARQSLQIRDLNSGLLGLVNFYSFMFHINILIFLCNFHMVNSVTCMNVGTIISEYNQTYRKHTSCYYCLGLTLCYNTSMPQASSPGIPNVRLLYCKQYSQGICSILSK